MSGGGSILISNPATSHFTFTAGLANDTIAAFDYEDSGYNAVAGTGVNFRNTFGSSLVSNGYLTLDRCAYRLRVPNGGGGSVSRSINIQTSGHNTKSMGGSKVLNIFKLPIGSGQWTYEIDTSTFNPSSNTFTASVAIPSGNTMFTNGSSYLIYFS
jgi:hypothetical protein